MPTIDEPQVTITAVKIVAGHRQHDRNGFPMDCICGDKNCTALVNVESDE